METCISLQYAKHTRAIFLTFLQSFSSYDPNDCYYAMYRSKRVVSGSDRWAIATVENEWKKDDCFPIVRVYVMVVVAVVVDDDTLHDDDDEMQTAASTVHVMTYLPLVGLYDWMDVMDADIPWTDDTDAVEEASNLHLDAAVPRWSCALQNCEDDDTDIPTAERFPVASRRPIRAYPVETMVTELVDTSSPHYEGAAVGVVGSSDDRAHKEEEPPSEADCLHAKPRKSNSGLTPSEMTTDEAVAVADQTCVYRPL
jgi:hypothetical protein